MKTYTRKRRQRQDYKIIEDVHDLCRLCLARVEEPVPIFERADNACAAVPMRIMICVGYEITQEDCLPNTICTKCHHELERYYKFRKKCEDSYLKLKSHFAATKYQERITEVLAEKVFDEKEKQIEYQKIQEDTAVDEIVPLVISDVYNIDENGAFETPMISSIASMAETVNVDENVDVTAENQQEVSPNISTFLNAILVELGILVKNEQGLVVQDQGVTSFELETGDDDQVIFELVEGDDELGGKEINAQPEPVEVYVIAEPLEQNNKPEEIAEIKPKEKSKKVRVRKNFANTYKNSGAWCSICGRTFACRSTALRHGAVHSGARPHACPVPACGRTFAQKVVMKRHLLLHQENRPYQCPECTKSFAQRTALATHVRSHVAPHARALTLHACTQCDRVFLYSSGLSRHMMTHSGRMFSCGTCERLFNDKSSLLRHVRTAHPPALHVPPLRDPPTPSTQDIS